MTTLDFMEAVLKGTSIWAASWGMTYELSWSEDSLAGNWFQDLCKLCFSGKTVTINSNLKKLKLKKNTCKSPVTKNNHTENTCSKII